MHIPQPLLEQLERGNVFLFIGERILLDAGEQAVMDRLVFELASRCQANDPGSYTFAEAAQACQDEMGRHELIRFVRDRLEAMGNTPQPIHRLIAKLTCCKILATTCLDCRLEQAIKEEGRPLNIIDENADIAFQDQRKTSLYKLRGSIDRVESLVLTEDDYEAFYDDEKSISLALQAHLACKTILFVGYDLADPYFKRLYSKVTDSLDTFARRSYIIGMAPAQRVIRWCARHNIEVIQAEVTEFLEKIIEQQKAWIRADAEGGLFHAPELPAKPLPELPYKLLDFYEDKDEAIFFGRERETQQLVSLIHAHRLTLLYGASGVGKTSLLLAGVLPKLERASLSYETISVRVREDPALLIRRTVKRLLPESDLPENGSLVEYLDKATEAGKFTLVIVFDQFEEFFIRFSPKFRVAFIDQLGQLYEARDIPVKLVFSLREDWLAAMSEIEARIPEVYTIRMRLLPLGRDQARRAISAPVDKLGIYYEPALLERLMDDLAGQQPDDAAGETAGVMPPQLQLVCNALYQRVVAEGRARIAEADYQAIGQVEGILTRYIESALQEHPGQERETAKNVLMSMVTSQATKVWLDLKRIAADAGADEPTVERVLDRLVRQRLVRRLDEGRSYELAHDIIAALIANWIGQEEQQLKRARELLRRELADWRQDPTILLSRGRFRRINTIRERLKLTEEEATFLLRAAILYGEEVDYWLEAAGETRIKVKALLEMLGHEADSARLTSAIYLAKFPRDEVSLALAAAALEDTNPAVRDAAAVNLAQMGSQAGLAQLMAATQANKRPQQQRAVRAMALIQDIAPGRVAQAGSSAQLALYIELARIRFWRHWPRIRLTMAAVAAGGAVGFGLGLTPPVIWYGSPVFGGVSLLDILGYGLAIAILGLLVGAGQGFGLSASAALFGRRGRSLGSIVSGGLSFAAVLSLLLLGSGAGFSEFLLAVIGSGLFGMMIGLGMTVAPTTGSRYGLMLGGGAVGGGIGLVLWHYLGFMPKHEIPVFILFPFGGLVGLIIAFSLAWAERRLEAEKRGRRESGSPSNQPATLPTSH